MTWLGQKMQLVLQGPSWPCPYPISNIQAGTNLPSIKSIKEEHSIIVLTFFFINEKIC